VNKGFHIIGNIPITILLRIYYSLHSLPNIETLTGENNFKNAWWWYN